MNEKTYDLNNEEEEKILAFIKFLKQSSSNYQKMTGIFHFAEKNGFHITRNHFYSPIPSVHQLDKKLFEVKKDIHIDWNENNQLELLKKFQKYANEYQYLIDKNKFNDKNASFGWHDAPIYYFMIRHFKPKKIIEVGVGYSTIIASLAAEKNQHTKITAIDPFLRKLSKPRLPDKLELIEKPVQEIPISLFEELSENDILFIDDSHVSKIGSDVNFLFLEVFPILKKGVIVHIHDIFLPKDYPSGWILNDHNRFWNEQYLLQAFLIGNSEFEVLLANAFLGYKHPNHLLNLYKTNPPVSGGGSFWIRKKLN